MLSKCPGKKDIFKELRVRFVNFLKIIILELFFVSNNFMLEGILWRSGSKFSIELELLKRDFWVCYSPGLFWPRGSCNLSDFQVFFFSAGLSVN